ncbi:MULTISPECIES: hypothetical protein [Tenebrionibacter/Tenebrionicola group]|jgi:hypothetical protein|uniref:Uncharacterized protein n=2 Tax=Tenebrionibacter/Tenebrionicola group TaxID=2969848 RepID=A0A8K0UZN6_9ENTR|nr:MULTISPECIES: hypothetical protein [Tenebrionibacter/Tenebrionicola group]MBK4713798.1 hypothetical protein [Tenebrionibacter intestinalis]MBV5094679.1 hypothetical protein [Tenebrionicola larvae]
MERTRQPQADYLAVSANFVMAQAPAKRAAMARFARSSEASFVTGL